ncbi:MAG: cytoplasmic protein [Elusimicrobia bacterium RIFOXYA2_FULL_40_6]|nr:MAG: cytoplasmic protein [Elusimicrobia bacterium RIFOXYA2_FULL_40_6]
MINKGLAFKGKPQDRLFEDVRGLIDSARSHVARTVNTSLVMLYWHIGDRIRKDILRQERAEYGEEIVVSLAQQLTIEYGEGYSRASLFRMIQFVEKFHDKEIVVTLSRQLTWSHFFTLLPVQDKLKREFYTEMCRIENWNVRTLRRKIDGMLFERTALSRKPKKLAEIEIKALRDKDCMTPDIAFKDPYFLDFLGLKDTFKEKDFEAAIIREMEHFILELGTDFTFVARQKRIMIGRDDFYIDLLFYHRRLKCLVAIELKMDDFKAEYKGQMELYLRWLEKYDMRPGENRPVGLILCGKKNHEQIELLKLGESGIRVSEYLTELPAQAELKKKLQDIVERGRKLFESRDK